jgi:toxin ParE1/3/4
MTARVAIRRRADRDLEDRGDFLARSSTRTARRFYQAARETFEQLAAMPGLGSPWESDRPELTGLRVFAIRGFSNDLIFYRPLEGEDGIEVIRVLHASRDIEGILEGEPS